MRVVLASSSPRRLELLRAVGVEPEVLPAEVDESAQPGEAPETMVLRLATGKARAVAGRVQGPALVLGADTVVVRDAVVLGKPRDSRDLRRMLESLSGRSHQVLTGVCLIDREPDGRLPDVELTGLATTTVVFAALAPGDIDWYVASGEGFDKAGGYAVQGLAALFIPEIRGSWSNVVGLPLDLLHRLATALGRDLRQLSGRA